MKKVNILVVDDRTEGFLAVQAVLDSSSYNLVKAQSGSEALKHLLDMDFAVILMDVQMPGMNGYEAATIIKTREKSRHIPIIFMSAINKDEQYVYQGYEVGAVEYLVKPFDPVVLRSKVAVFVDLFLKEEKIKEQARMLLEKEITAHAQEIDKLEIEGLRKYQYLADTIPQIVFRLFPDGTYEYFNQLWFAYTGFSGQQSEGRGWMKSIHPDDIHHLMSLFQGPREIKQKEFECRLRNAVGIYRWHLIRAQPETYTDPSLISSWLGTATDIEDRKHNENIEKFFAKTGEILVSSLDFADSFREVSAFAVPMVADICLIDVINEDGQLVSSAVGHRSKRGARLIKAFHNKNLISMDDKKLPCRVIRSGNPEIHFGRNGQNNIQSRSAIIVPITVRDKVLGAVTLVLIDSHSYTNADLTWGKELARRLAMALQNSLLYKVSQQAIEIRNDFLSIASHELNTPITSLKLQLQMLQRSITKSKEDKLPTDKLISSVNVFARQVERLINLVSVLLDVSRIQSGKFTFSFSKINALELIQEVLERQVDIIESSNCELEVDAKVDVTVNWDKLRIEQVIINLLNNAARYAPGKIELTVFQKDSVITMIVQDHGPGIPADKLNKVFERFEQVKGGHTVGGLGLGLFIVRQIVEGHNGEIFVESKVGKGSRFTIKLPVDPLVYSEKERLKEA